MRGKSVAGTVTPHCFSSEFFAAGAISIVKEATPGESVKVTGTPAEVSTVVCSDPNSRTPTADKRTKRCNADMPEGSTPALQCGSAADSVVRCAASSEQM